MRIQVLKNREMGDEVMQGVFNGTQMPGSFNQVMTQLKQGSKSEKTAFAYQEDKAGTKKKKLHYNSKEIPAQLLNARKSTTASSVLGRARSMLNRLKALAASGKYDENEVKIAVAHADKVVRCAEMKAQNLREEEVLHRQNEQERELKLQKDLRRALEKTKKRNREEEFGKINQAEMEYLKDGGGNIPIEADMSMVMPAQVNYQESGVFLELSSGAAPSETLE